MVIFIQSFVPLCSLSLQCFFHLAQSADTSVNFDCMYVCNHLLHISLPTVQTTDYDGVPCSLILHQYINHRPINNDSPDLSI